MHDCVTLPFARLLSVDGRRIAVVAHENRICVYKAKNHDIATREYLVGMIKRGTFANFFLRLAGPGK